MGSPLRSPCVRWEGEGGGYYEGSMDVWAGRCIVAVSNGRNEEKRARVLRAALGRSSVGGGVE